MIMRVLDRLGLAIHELESAIAQFEPGSSDLGEYSGGKLEEEMRSALSSIQWVDECLQDSPGCLPVRSCFDVTSSPPNPHQPIEGESSSAPQEDLNE